MGTSPTVVDAALAGNRLARLRDAANRAGVAATVVTPGSDLRYLLGIAGSSFERLTCLVVPTDGGAPVFVSPASRPTASRSPT